MIKKTERISSSAHYGNGLVMCSPRKWDGKKYVKESGCSKQDIYISQVNAGNYKDDRITPYQEELLRRAAKKHDKAFPKHRIRVIIWERKK